MIDTGCTVRGARAELCAVIVAMAAWGVALPAIADMPQFTEKVIDPSMAGDVKMVADIDGDGKLDPIVGGSTSEGLVWYHMPDFAKTRIATPVVQFTTDGETRDMNGDGSPDIVTGDGNITANVIWFQNPRPGGNPSLPSAWTRRAIGSAGGWVKDVEPADFDGDGRSDVAVRTNTSVMVFYQVAANEWQKVTLAAITEGEGMARGDIDNDGRTDLIIQGRWLRNPGGAGARNGSGWKSYPIGSAPKNFKALAMDLNGDGKAEVIYTSSENTADVTVWRRQAGNLNLGWVPTVALADVERAHTLGSGDMDGDGDRDLVVGQMHTSAQKRLMILENVDGRGQQWLMHVIGTGGLHNGRVVDMDGDGDADIFGANWTGNPPVRIWLNQRR